MDRNNNHIYNDSDMELVQIEYDDIPIGMYSMKITLEAEVIAVDRGIGGYEFWGSKGYHTDIRKEIQSPVYIEDIELLDEDGEAVKVSQDLQNLVEQWMNANLNQIEEKIIEKAAVDC